MNCKICDKIFDNPNKHIQNCKELNHDMKEERVQSSMDKPFCHSITVFENLTTCLLCKYSW